MKRYKRLYLLLGVLAVACIATFGVLRFEEYQEQIKNSDEIILKVPSDTVTSLSWEYQEESLSFHKEEVWLYDEDEAFPVSEEKINGLLAQFEEFGASFIIENVQDYGWMSRFAPSGFPPMNRNMRCSWAITAAWIPSGTFQSEMEMSIWCKTTRWISSTQCSAT